jgi:uncharacterized RDD family membrane protein YckC/ribosomal protein L40E
MFCTQCGAPLRPGASFCGSCGWNVPSIQTLRAEVEEREARGLKLCVKCRSEIPIDATVCHRCDAPQPGGEGFAAALPRPEPVWRPAPPPPTAVTAVTAPELATIGRRIGAGIIDLIVITIAAAIVLAITGEDPFEDGQISGPGIYIIAAIMFGYYIVAEALTGQTAGKRLTGIRVVAEDGAPISWGKSAGRNLLRIVDGFPGGVYIVGIIVMSFSDQLQRVGDRAARTIVIVDRPR